jgi:hypothetical protein
MVMNVTPIGVTQVGEWLYDKEIAELDPQDSRDELIASIKDEMVAKRKAAMSDDDIQAALENCTARMAGIVRDAMQRKDKSLSLAALEIMFDSWLEYDAEIEAIKSVENLEREMKK